RLLASTGNDLGLLRAVVRDIWPRHLENPNTTILDMLIQRIEKGLTLSPSLSAPLFFLMRRCAPAEDLSLVIEAHPLPDLIDGFFEHLESQPPEEEMFSIIEDTWVEKLWELEPGARELAARLLLALEIPAELTEL